MCPKRDSRFVYISTGWDSSPRLLTEQAQAYTMADAAPPIAQDAKAVMIKSPDATPTRSPSKRSIMITQGQKQALIDNLQLESKASTVCQLPMVNTQACL